MWGGKPLDGAGCRDGPSGMARDRFCTRRGTSYRTGSNGVVRTVRNPRIGYYLPVNRPYKAAAGITVIVLGILAGLWLVVTLRTLVLLIVVAGLLATAFDRPVSWVQRRLRLPRRGLAVALVLLAFLLGLALFGYLAYRPFVHQTRVFREGLPTLMNRVKQLPIAGQYLRKVDLTGDTQRFLKELPGRLSKNKNVILGVAQTALTDLVLVLTTIVTAVFLLLHGPRITDGAANLILDDFKRARARRLATNMQQAVSGYVSGNLLISLLAAAVTAISLTAMRVPFVAVLAAIMFILDLVPLVGATLGGGVVALATFVLAPDPWKALIFVGIFAVYQQLETHTVYPLIMGRTVKISSLGVFLVTLTGAELGGVLGALIAIPVGAVINVVLKDLIQERRNKAEIAAPVATRLELAISARRAGHVAAEGPPAVVEAESGRP
jgi:predicted PurR-regulated permease PerM